MNRRTSWSIALGLMLVSGVVFAAQMLTVEEIMEKAHKSKKGYRDKLKAIVGDATPNWGEASKLAKSWVEIAEMLGKNTPAKGKVESWKKLCAEYVEDVKALQAAVEKKDPLGYKAADMAMAQKCAVCHNIHRPGGN